MKNNITIFLLIVSIANVYAQNTTLLEGMKSHLYHLEINNQELTGSGLPIINKAIEESQFLMIGEQHGIVEASQFVKALSKKSFNKGFEYLCIETDSYIATKLEELTLLDNSKVTSYLNKYPYTIPFYSNKEEFELIKYFNSNVNHEKETIWGLDQIYMGTPRYLFDFLAEKENNPNTKKALLEYSTKAQNQFNGFLQTQNPTELAMMKLDDLDFEKLNSFYLADSEILNRKLISDLRKSQEIYKHIFIGENYWNNYKRSKLMKEKFMSYYNKYSANEHLPKVIFKFGAVHITKGVSPVHLYDIGNMVMELAEMNKTVATNFKIVALKGESIDYKGTINSLDNSSNFSKEILQLCEAHAEENKWLMLDFKSMRTKLPHDILKDKKEMIFGYDILIIVPNGNPLTKMN